MTEIEQGNVVYELLHSGIKAICRFYIGLSIVDMVLGTFILTLIFAIALLIPSISIAARRLHDTGRTGWWQLILFVPLIGVIVMLIFLIQDSHDDNQYGPNPKAAA